MSAGLVPDGQSSITIAIPLSAKAECFPMSVGCMFYISLLDTWKVPYFSLMMR